MSNTKVYTIDTTLNDVLLEMMNSVPQTEMRLINYRFKMDYTGVAEANIPDVLYLDIGTVIGSNFFIDNNVSSYRFPIMLDNSYKNGDGISVTYGIGVNIPLTMQGSLDHAVRLRIYTKNGVLIDQDILKHCFLQFEYN